MADPLAELVGATTHDPLAYARGMYRWGEGELEGKKLRKWQARTLDKIGTHLRGPDRFKPLQIAVSSGHGIGKALAHGEPVLTPGGWVPIEAVRVGDRVATVDGGYTTVEGVWPQGMRDVFRVELDDGTSVVVDGDHQWLTSTRSERKRRRKPKVRTTREIAESLSFPNGPRRGLNHQLPALKPVDGVYQELPVDPYVMGAWLGDGDGQGRVTGMPESLDRIESAGCTLGVRVRKAGTAARAATILGLRVHLRSMGLHGKRAHEKRVPRRYMHASREQREALLQGLLDTDGHANGLGNISFEVVSERLADDVAELVRSLGGVARRSQKQGAYGGKVCRRVHRVFVSLPEGIAPFRDPAKVASYVPQWGHRNCDRTRRRHIARVVPVGRSLATCISVAHPSRLFVTRDHIVTHNSALMGMIASWGVDTCRDTRIVMTANTEEQLRGKTWPEVCKWRRLSLSKDWWHCGKTVIQRADEPSDSWEVRMVTWSEHNLEAFAGLHNLGKRIILLMDEGSAIADKVWEVAQGAMTDKDTEIIWVVFGNPTRATGRFRECFRRYRHRWHIEQIDSREVEDTNKELFDEWESDYGADSDFFKVRVRGLFPAMSAKQFISEDDVDAAYGRKLDPDSYLFAPKILVCDPAWRGDDPLVIGMRQGLMYWTLRSIPKNDNDIQIANLLAELEDEHHADAVFVDMGFGTGIVSAGKTLGRKWRLVNFGEQRHVKPGYLNKRSEMWGAIKDWLKEGGCIEEDPILRDELLGPELLDRLDGKIALEPKAAMKKRGLPSPNRADGLAISFAYPVKPKQRHRTTLGKANRKHTNPYDALKPSRRR